MASTQATIFTNTRVCWETNANLFNKNTIVIIIHGIINPLGEQTEKREFSRPKELF